MLRLLCVGDPHIGKSPSFLKPGQWRSYVADMLETALKFAVNNTVSGLVIMGDTFDHPRPEPLDLAVLTAFLYKAHAAGLHVHIITGNHDYEEAGFDALEPFKVMSDKVTVYARETTTSLEGVPVRFLPWRPHDAQNSVSKFKSKTPHLVIMHDVISGAIMDNGWVAGTEEKPRRQDFVVAGHLHQHQKVGKNAVYVGTALPSFWNHKPQGFTLVEAKLDSGKLNVTHYQIPYTPPFYMKEVKLSKFPLNTADKHLTYYKVILKVGQKLPNDKRIVASKPSKRVARTIDHPSETDQKVGKLQGKQALPDPLNWLVSRIKSENQAKARAILSDIASKTNIES